MLPRYIGAEYSLFNEEYCTLTVDILKDCLEIIEHNTPIKDVDYWQFYDAIQLFLYGELSNQGEGEIWGISNFHSVWESICLTYLVKNYDSEYILHLDVTFLANEVVDLANSKPKHINLTDAFIINNQRLIPDAVVFHNSFSEKQVIENFHLTAGNWDDFSYRTTFFADSDYFRDYTRRRRERERRNDYTLLDLKIVHESQRRDTTHTFTELEKYYEKQDGRLIINSQLSSNFYFYWTIESHKLDSQVFALMQQLNHVFYVAIKNGVCNSDSFYEFLLNTEKKFDNCINNYQPFRHSLLLGCYFPPSSKLDESNNPERDIVLMFNNFLQATATTYLKIIDIKYLDFNYFKNTGNCRDIKERSIRKQFVYEYLLQQHINKNNNFKELEIKSSFWIPSCFDENIVFKNETILGGYIDLNSVNFNKIADNYLL